jgi:Reverse transcriptase (RNA-dependent DNA polymerase)
MDLLKSLKSWKANFVVDGEGERKQFNIAQVRPYYNDPLETHLSTLSTMFSSLASHPNIDRDKEQILVSETISSTDPRATSPEAAAAKRKKIAGLIARNTWKIVCKQDVRDSANILDGRFILTIKDVNTGNQFFKARYVVQGHKDCEKAQLVHNSTTLTQSSTNLILSFAALFRFRVWNQDVTQAYTQSALALMRKIFLQPAKNDLDYFEMTSDEVLQLLRPLYGLADAGDYWNVTMVDHMLNDLGLARTDSDLSLFYSRLNNRLNGISGTCVDDSLHAGSANYLELTEKSQKMFLSRERKFDNITFNGADIQSNDDGTFSLCQTLYIFTLKLFRHLLQRHLYRLSLSPRQSVLDLPYASRSTIFRKYIRASHRTHFQSCQCQIFQCSSGESAENSGSQTPFSES